MNKRTVKVIASIAANEAYCNPVPRPTDAIIGFEDGFIYGLELSEFSKKFEWEYEDGWWSQANDFSAKLSHSGFISHFENWKRLKS